MGNHGDRRIESAYFFAFVAKKYPTRAWSLERFCNKPKVSVGISAERWLHNTF